MPARPGQPFQRILPGMGQVARKEPAPVTPEAPPAWNDRRRYTGPTPGQLVMGVHDLADQNMKRGSPFGGGAQVADGPYEVNEHGYIREDAGVQGHDAAVGDAAAHRLYGTHGGRWANPLGHGTDETPSDMGYGEDDVSEHKQRMREVKKHWDSMPVQQFPTSALVHTGQGTDETEGDEQEVTKRTAGGSPVPQRTAGGTPRSWTPFGTSTPIQSNDYTTVPGSGEGRARIEGIKRDLESGSQIKKPIWMVKMNGRHYQLDGHHRMVAAREAGVSHVPVRMWDMDAPRSSAPHAGALQHAVGANPALAQATGGGGRSAAFGALRDLANR